MELNGNGLIYQVHIIFKHIMILKHLSEHCFLPKNIADTGSHLGVVLRNGVSNTTMADQGAVKIP